ncbi:unnamed protein product [Arabidopsis arenosa]|uniref:Uncharacterized protein n=1 Tax=Arabidopsis arenosa TaxID=38785 RepID=A0A8S2AXZ8_ARAAE|nr:unnamed protein product [Arabidopsis arenosa]
MDNNNNNNHNRNDEVNHTVYISFNKNDSSVSSFISYLIAAFNRQGIISAFVDGKSSHDEAVEREMGPENSPNYGWCVSSVKQHTERFGEEFDAVKDRGLSGDQAMNMIVTKRRSLERLPPHLPMLSSVASSTGGLLFPSLLELPETQQFHPLAYHRINEFERVGSFKMLEGYRCWYKAPPICCISGKVVDFHRQGVTKVGISLLASLKKLSLWDLGGLPVTDQNLIALQLSGMILLGHVPQLETFSLSQTFVDDLSILLISTMMPCIKALDLGMTSIRGFILQQSPQEEQAEPSLAALQSLTSLKTLSLEHPYLGDTALSALSSLTGLTHLQTMGRIDMRPES